MAKYQLVANEASAWSEVSHNLIWPRDLQQGLGSPLPEAMKRHWRKPSIDEAHSTRDPQTQNEELLGYVPLGPVPVVLSL